MADRLAAEINPYAPSAVASEAQPEVGVWREGPMLVMHKDAMLPRMCIATGLPAVGSRQFRLVWHAAGELLAGSKYVRLPLSQAPLDSFHRAWVQSIIGWALALVAVVAGLMTPVLSLLGTGVLLAVLVPSLALGALGIGLWWVNYRTMYEPLKVVYAYGAYLWIAGTHPAFLDHLPPWPAARGAR
jgi:hypothetical protein